MARPNAKTGARPRQLNRVPTGPVTCKVEIPRELSGQLDVASKEAGMTKSQLIVSLCGDGKVVPIEDETAGKLDRLCKKDGVGRATMVQELVAREVTLYQKNGIRV